MTVNIDYRWDRLKDIVEKEARQEEGEMQEQEVEQSVDNIDLTATENERALKGVYIDFAIPRLPKVDIDGYADWPKSHFKALIEDQLWEMQSPTIITITYWR